MNFQVKFKIQRKGLFHDSGLELPTVAWASSPGQLKVLGPSTGLGDPEVVPSSWLIKINIYF